MGVHRRRVLAGSVVLFLSGGCLGEASLPTPFDLRIENQDTQSRELSVVVDHVPETVVYEETHRLEPDELVTEPTVAEEPGRYRLSVSDTTADEERTAERNVELSTGGPFCGWFVVRAEPESVTAAVPRCPDDETNESADSPADSS